MKAMTILVAVMVAGGAMAAPLKGLQVWAGRQPSGTVERVLSQRGLTNSVTQAAATAEWDEDVLLDAALAERAYGLVNWAMTQSPFSDRGRGRVKAAVLEEVQPVREAIDLALRFPLDQRDVFRPTLEAALPVRFADRPVYGRLYIEQTVLRGVPCFSTRVPVEDLVDVLLANEAMSVDNVRQCKEAIKQQAIILARLNLRAEGKSFVTPKDGPNPLAERVAPVVAALNAPACEGLEAELRKLGLSIDDVDRSGPAAAAEVWKAEIMSGAMSGSAAGQVLGKLAVVLGPEAYNRFVDEYNNGAAAQPPAP